MYSELWDMCSEKADLTNLAVEIRLRWFRRVQLQPLSDTLAEDMQGRIGLHDLAHSLLDQGLHAGEPIAIR